ALAERHRLLAGVQRGQLAEAIHPGRTRLQIVPADRGLHALEVVANRQHLATGLADRQHALGVVPPTADRALDVAGEAHAVTTRRRPVALRPGWRARRSSPLRPRSCRRPSGTSR